MENDWFAIQRSTIWTFTNVFRSQMYMLQGSVVDLPIEKQLGKAETGLTEQSCLFPENSNTGFRVEDQGKSMP